MANVEAVRAELARLVEERRRQDVVFAVAVVCATPGLVAVSLWAAVVFLGDVAEVATFGFLPFVLVAVVGGYMWLVWNRARAEMRTRAVEVAVALGCVVALVAFGVASLRMTSRLDGHPVLETGIALVALAALGRIWVQVGGDSPLDAHVGMATLGPTLLLEAWGEVFSGGVGKRTPPEVVARAAELLPRARTVSVTVEAEDLPALRLLVELKLGQELTGRRLDLTMAGRELLGTRAVHAAR